MLGEGIEQLCVFAVFCVLGVGFCAIYLFALGLTRTRLAAIVFDTIFAACCLYVTWRVNLDVNNGECRAFIFVGLAVGCVITYITCKHTLDKLSSMLYNLFTTKLVNKNDGKDILQEINSSNIRSGSDDSSVTAVHAFGDTDTAVVTKRSRRRIGKANISSAGRRSRVRKAERVHAIQRLRQRVGAATRSHR